MFSEICGWRFIFLSDEPETFTSPSYPHNYPANLACKWEIRSSGNPVISVHIEDFETETANDVVSFEGRTFYSDSPEVFTMDGSTKVRTIVFNSSSLFLMFESDSSKEYSGFLLSLESNFSFTGKNYSTRFNQSMSSRPSRCSVLRKIP